MIFKILYFLGLTNLKKSEIDEYYSLKESLYNIESPSEEPEIIEPKNTNEREPYPDFQRILKSKVDFSLLENCGIKQRTLKNQIKATGVGLKTGNKLYVRLGPLPENTGIVFKVDDGEKNYSIRVSPFNVDYEDGMDLVDGANRVLSIGPIMAAFSGLGIDNAEVLLSSNELPIMDGSAAPFVFLIQSAGVLEQKLGKIFFRVKKKKIIKTPEGQICIEPFDGFKISYVNGSKCIDLDFSCTSFVKEVSRARAFYNIGEDTPISAMPKGLSLDNALIIDGYRIVNEDGLRLDDECEKKIILDAVGAFYPLGSVIGHITVSESFCAEEGELIRSTVLNDSAWEPVYFYHGEKEESFDFGFVHRDLQA